MDNRCKRTVEFTRYLTSVLEDPKVCVVEHHAPNLLPDLIHPSRDHGAHLGYNTTYPEVYGAGWMAKARNLRAPPWLSPTPRHLLLNPSAESPEAWASSERSKKGPIKPDLLTDPSRKGRPTMPSERHLLCLAAR